MLNRIFAAYFLTLMAFGLLNVPGEIFLIFSLATHSMFTWVVISRHIKITLSEVMPFAIVNVSIFFVSLVSLRTGKT
jgi:hypothetical protein